MNTSLHTPLGTQVLPEWPVEQQWPEEETESLLSDAERGATLFSTRQGRAMVLAIIIGIGCIGILYMGAARLLALGLLPAGVLVGAYLYWKHPTLYVGYSWWVWMLSSFVRRIVEIKTGWNQQSPILLLPFAVSAITIFTLLRHLPSLSKRGLFPMGLALIGLLYGYGVGIYEAGIFAATYAFAIWVIPLLFGFYIAVNWKVYPEMRVVLGRAVFWSVMLTSSYGIIQYFHPLSWDMFWIYATHIPALGRPAPMAFRVFSTLNSPAPFGVMLAACLVYLLSKRTAGGMLALALGAICFLLVGVRSAWLGFAVGFILYVRYIPARALARVGFALMVMVAVLICVLNLTAAGDKLAERFSTFGNLQNDVSMNARKQLYANITDHLLDSPEGQGLGSTGAATTLNSNAGMDVIDSGVLDVFYSLGWAGGLFFFAGVLTVVARCLTDRSGRDDQVDMAYRCAAVCVFAMMVAFNSMVGVSGLVFWTFVGITLCRRSAMIEYQRLEEEHAYFQPSALVLR